LRDGVVYTEVLSVNIARPDKASSCFSIERSSGTMSDTKNVGIFGGGVSDLGEGRDAVAARELKDVGGILNDYLD
jgi:hypothetical protein